MYIFQAVERLKRALIFECRRNHLKVLSDILELCRTPHAKTYILHSTNTSFKLLKTYLLQLQTSCLLERLPQTKKYQTTDKGRRFVDLWLNLEAMLYPQELPIVMKNSKSAKRSGKLITVSAADENCQVP